MAETNLLSPLQFTILVINISFGTNLLILPRAIAEVAKEDMWLSILLGSTLIIFSFWCSLKLSELFPDMTVMDYTHIILGRWLGTAANIYVLLLLLLIASSMLRVFRIAVQIFLLDLTPPQVIAGVFLLLVVYCCQSGWGTLTRSQYFIFGPGFVLFCSVVLIGFLSVDFHNFQPILANGVLPVLSGAKTAWFAYSGPELLIGFIYPLFYRQKHIFRYGMLGIGTITLLYTIITMIVQGILGVQETIHVIMPTMMAYRSVEIPDTFLERLDGYLMTIWIAACFCSLINWVYCLGVGYARMAKLDTPKPLIVLLVPVILLLEEIPPNIQISLAINEFTGQMGLIWGVAILPGLLLIAGWKRRRRIC